MSLQQEKPHSNINDIFSIEISVATDDDIRQLAFNGADSEKSIREVTKADTINYRTQRPERGGLFDERIFGPVHDFQCACGKNFRGMVHAIQTCPSCGVDITWSRARRERMGYIELAAPVVNPLYAYSSSGLIAYLLGVSPRALEPVINYLSYIVIDPGNSDFKKCDIIDEMQYRELQRTGSTCQVGMGAEALEQILKSLDLDDLVADLRDKYIKSQSSQSAQRLSRRIRIIEQMIRSGTKPQDLIMRVLPVLPPDLRPMIRLDGGRFAASDLNELYRRVIIRNNRLKQMLDIFAPEAVLRNEKRLLQSAVDALFINSRRPQPVTGGGKRVLKSLYDNISGKQGRFRQNLLGKRVDYSGRSVIVVGPQLKLDQVGLPKEMALELFKPMVMRELVRAGYAQNIRGARRQIQAQEEHVWEILEQVVADHPVLLNRAPTLHKHSIQAFKPVLVEGRAIQLHPLVCSGYNADFDGDTMSVHVPLSAKAQAEALLLMLSSNNLLDPKNGRPMVKPDKDMVIGLYYMTMAIPDDKSTKTVFASPDMALYAYRTNKVHLGELIWVNIENSEISVPQGAAGTWLLTTPGFLLFNRLLPSDFPFINSGDRLSGITADDLFTLQEINEGKTADVPIPISGRAIGRIVSRCIERYGMQKASEILDELKEKGFSFATKSGLSFGISDVEVPKLKRHLLEYGLKQAEDIYDRRDRGELTEREAYEAVLGVWQKVNEQMTDIVMNSFDRNHPLRIMLSSGARANPTQVRQLSGWRGIMIDPMGRAIEVPIQSSFREGLGVLEYFISTHGARKGQADTALKTADSGYLTRRLVDVCQHVFITEEDCGTSNGLMATAKRDRNGNLLAPLADAIAYRVLAEDILGRDGKIAYHKGVLITPDMAEEIADLRQTVLVRSPLTCASTSGICRLCYGKDLGRNALVELGTAVGVIAAQSIGEPGTQLTMRTFHTGGVSGGDITQGLPRVEELLEARNPKVKAVLARLSGECRIRQEGQVQIVTVISTEGPVSEAIEHIIPYGQKLLVKDRQIVDAGEPLCEGALNLRELLQLRGRAATASYLISEVQRVYRSQGVAIHDKHIEIVVRQMLDKVRVIDAGDTSLLPGEIVSRQTLTEANSSLPAGAHPAQYEDMIMGITKAALATDSFLSAASFQRTIQVLTEAALARKQDYLQGLKENVILGRLIPSGTGFTQRPVKGGN